MTRTSPDGRVRELVEQGDVRAAATEAIARLGPEVLRYVRALLRDEDMAADAFSDFAENLWKNLPSFRWSGSLRTWAFKIATRAAFDVQQEAWRRRRRRLASSEASRLAAQVWSTAARVERQQQWLDAVRESLSVEERALLTLRVDRELSWQEVAEALSAEGESVEAAAVAKRFERLKERLAAVAGQRESPGDS